MAKVILYIATSQDGFIADPQGDVDWLPQADDEADEFGYKALMARISVIAMGSTSYQQILGFGAWAWPDKKTFVFTAQPLNTSPSGVVFITTDAQGAIGTLRAAAGDKDIWLLGGAKLASSFDQENLIDECIITIIPVTLGAGIPLEISYDHFTCTRVKNGENSIVQKFYSRHSYPS